MQAGPQIDDSLAGDSAKARPAVQSITGKTHVARSPKSLRPDSRGQSLRANPACRPLRADPCVPTLACDVLEVGALTVHGDLPLPHVRGMRGEDRGGGMKALFLDCN